MKADRMKQWRSWWREAADKINFENDYSDSLLRWTMKNETYVDWLIIELHPSVFHYMQSYV